MYDNSGDLIREYVYLNSEPLAQIDESGGSESLTYLHTDHLGTPRFGTNTSGTQIWAWDSDAFGNGSPTGTATVNLRFPGQYFDTESDLHYNWNRYYNPETGRYIASDPIGLDGGLNTYLYASLNSIRFVDPEGLLTLEDAKRSLEARGVEKTVLHTEGTAPVPIYTSGYTIRQIFLEWVRLEIQYMKKTNWIADLPQCPKCIANGTNPDTSTWEDPKPLNSYSKLFFHPGGAWEMRSKPLSNGSSSQCIYDENKILITSKEDGAAGSADLYSPSVSTSKHYYHDVKTFEAAQKLGQPGIYLYYKVRPVK